MFVFLSKLIKMYRVKSLDQRYAGNSSYKIMVNKFLCYQWPERKHYRIYCFYLYVSTQNKILLLYLCNLREIRISAACCSSGRWLDIFLCVFRLISSLLNVFTFWERFTIKHTKILYRTTKQKLHKRYDGDAFYLTSR